MSDRFLLENIPFFRGKDLSYSFDGLTGVLNREAIISYLNHLIDNSTPFSVGLLDIDYFKNINDSFGHLTGDKVLSEFGKKIISLLGDRCVLGRFGGDEFIFIMENNTNYEQVWNICHDISKNISNSPYKTADNQIFTLTMGISRYPIDGKNLEDIIAAADKALYRGKTKGRNCFIIYLPEKHQEIDLKGFGDT